MWINRETLELFDAPAEGLEPVVETPCPLTERLEKAVPDGAALVAGVWQQTWRIEPLSVDEVAQVEEAERINAGRIVRQLMERNNAAYEAATKALTADYPQLEKDTWPTQNEQAAAWVADPVNASTPWIDRAAAERGIDREEYLRRTLVKAEQFKILSAFLTGRRQKYEDEIKQGGDPTLDFALTAEVQMALYQASQTIMATPTADMKAALA